jgi:membrane-bound lytic murein transglycosylase B
MQVRRIFTIYALTLGMCLLFLANQAEPQAAKDDLGDDGSMRILARPDAAEDPSAVTVATPKGRRRVEPADLGHFDIPVTALTAYQRAADILVEVKPSCGLTWTLLAAIGRVESDHGRYGGAELGGDGVSSPQVVGVPLDGEGPVAQIRDTDGGRLDNDAQWDRAVGPMQFIPSTWSLVGVDGDGDGVRSVDDIDDAALAAGIYLCAGAESLQTRDAKEAALFRYNDSKAYVALVMAYERKYRGGDFVVTTPAGTVAEASVVLASHPLTGTPIRAGSPAEARLKARIEADARKAVATGKKTGGTTKGIGASGPEATRKALDGGGSDSPTAKVSAKSSESAKASGSSEPSKSASPDPGPSESGKPSSGSSPDSEPSESEKADESSCSSSGAQGADSSEGACPAEETTPPAPATSPPAEGSADDETTRVVLQLGPCWVAPVLFDGALWGLPLVSQFGRDVGLPEDWHGTGVVERLSADRVRYTDDGDAVVVFWPADDPAVPRTEDVRCD